MSVEERENAVSSENPIFLAYNGLNVCCRKVGPKFSDTFLQVSSSAIFPRYQRFDINR